MALQAITLKYASSMPIMLTKMRESICCRSKMHYRMPSIAEITAPAPIIIYFTDAVAKWRCLSMLRARLIC
eukprot:scaffold18893_cov118-Skeletonema_menzelii.AAC.1